MLYAGFWHRLASFVIDLAVFLPLYIVSYLLRADSRSMAVAMALLVPLAWTAYEISLHGRWGQSIGKRVARIRVLDVTGTRMSWKQTFLRYAVDSALNLSLAITEVVMLVGMTPEEHQGVAAGGLPSSLAALVPYLTVLFVTCLWVIAELVVLLTNPRKRAIHDYIAGTVVLHV